jgi:hypothetical protein
MGLGDPLSHLVTCVPLGHRCLSRLSHVGFLSCTGTVNCSDTHGAGKRCIGFALFCILGMTSDHMFRMWQYIAPLRFTQLLSIANVAALMFV